MDWDDLRFVLAVSRERTLTRAAESLRATHTTVGRRVRGFEESLGVRVFDPTPDGYVLTDAGREIVEVAERIEVELHALEARVLGQDAQLEGKLRVATLDLLLRKYHRAFTTFTARYPHVELTVTTNDAEVSLTRREADVAFRMTNTPPEYLVGRRVAEVEFAPYASKTLVERVGAGAKLSDYPWILWDERLNTRWLDDWLAANAPGAKVALRVATSTSGFRDLVAAGVGVHFLACFEGDADPSLVRIGEVDARFNRGLWLLTLAELRATSRVRAFMEHVEAALRTPNAV